ncbi:MAG TPA: extracellular solute-binding protein [Trebonia sp.]|nr:extracellular solute-binding protein [Trebonia sp.]
MAAALAAGCSSSSSSSSTSASSASSSSASAGSSSGATAKVSGTANVAYAGSLELLNEKTIGPAFQQATGAGYTGQGMGAVGLSQEIASGEIHPNVFESIGPYPLANVQPKFSTWYVGLVSSPIVVVYSPACPKYGSELSQVASGKLPMSKLFELMAEPGFTLGRTDPGTDPQGQAFWEMVQQAQSYYHLPAGTASKILGPEDNSKETYSETSINSFLESGELCAESDYRSEAIQQKLHYINLPDTLNFGEPNLDSTYAKYTMTLENGTKVHGVPTEVFAAPIGTKDSAAATAFINYQLQPSVRADFQKAGYTLVTPTIYGTGAPASVKSAVTAADASGS